MQLLSTDIEIHAYTPDDGSESAAIKVVHRTGRQEVVNQDTDSQRENLRRALYQLIAMMNPNPEHIPPPQLTIYDKVQVNLPESSHDGEVARISWDFPRSEWKYYVECPNHLVTTWYVYADLEPIDEDADEDDEEDVEED